uniref:hypothetical protein n=1 Tax=Gelidibacter sp. TaxID=2018083 RepID=UPI00404ABD3E
MYITENRLIKYALYSNALYVFFFFIFKPDGISIQKVLITSLLLMSVLILVTICYRNRKQISELPKAARTVFICLLIWSSITVMRGFSLNIQDWVTNFGNVYMSFAWFAPILIIIGQKIENWKVIIKAVFFMFQLMVIAMFIYPFQRIVQTEWTWLLRPLNFIVLLGLYRFKSTNRLLVYLTFIIYLIITIRVKQRIEFIYFALVLFFILIDILKQVQMRAKFLKLALFGFLILLFFVFTYGYENLTKLVSSLIEFEDSRTFLFKELMNELNFVEKIVGRGSLGTYYSHYFEHTKWYIVEVLNQRWWGDSSTRITTEVGYLQMILKGGFIMLFLNTFLMTYSAYLALFKSNNKFIKRLGLYILILLILSLISFRPAFEPTFIILWIAVGTVLNKKYREMKNEEIELLIKFK